MITPFKKLAATVFKNFHYLTNHSVELVLYCLH